MIATTSTPTLVPTLVATLAPAPVMTTIAPAPTLAPALASDATPAVAALSAPTSNNMPTPIMHKGRLHQYIQKESLPPAIYRTVNEGSEHLPRFLHIKEVEHDVAKIALESLRPRVKDEDFSLIHESSVLCKSILHEYAVKMQLEKPVYYIVQTSVQPSSFVSSLVINGVTYVGKNARTKKEAEQLVAQTVLLAISGGGESTSKTTLSKIISPKSKFLATLPKNNGFQNANHELCYCSSNSNK